MSEVQARTVAMNPDVALTLLPRAHDIGGFEVRRALPAKQRQMVGPFIFFDQMGPGELLIGQGLDVRPHPHIGLATVTYLFEGSIFHRDSLGSAQPIEPGAVNWMTAGRGIVHSERSAREERAHQRRIFGIQSWVALPRTAEDTEPGFTHHAADSLPQLDAEGVRLRLIAGEGWGLRSPVPTAWGTVYADVTVAPEARLPLPDHEERAAWLLSGEVEIAGDRFVPGQMLVFRAGDGLALKAGPTGARLMVLGGAAMDGPRHIWWNFVSSSHERIEQAKADWQARRMGLVPGDEQEFIPLPPPAVVRAETPPGEPPVGNAPAT
jgi:redox-sensitive bicupin YhaK (pirin superfamily)